MPIFRPTYLLPMYITYVYLTCLSLIIYYLFIYLSTRLHTYVYIMFMCNMLLHLHSSIYVFCCLKGKGYSNYNVTSVLYSAAKSLLPRSLELPWWTASDGKCGWTSDGAEPLNAAGHIHTSVGFQEMCWASWRMSNHLHASANAIFGIQS